MSFCNLPGQPPIISENYLNFQTVDEAFSELQENLNEVKQRLSSISKDHTEIRQRIEKLNQQMDMSAQAKEKCKINSKTSKIAEIKDSVLRKSIAIGAFALMIITGTIAAVFGSYLLSAPCLVIGTAGIIKCSLSIAEDVKQIKCLKV